MDEERYARQSFLGVDSQEIIEKAVIGIVGLGGGGSHIVQQLAHIGFMQYVIYDFDVVETTNLNRLVGAVNDDIVATTPKFEVAKRVIWDLIPKATVAAYSQRWQGNPGPLRGCDLIFGCVDGFNERRELEACARRYLIPLIDIGMDVHTVGDEPPRMGGQIILSMPNGSCMHCINFLNERVLAREGELYGDAGGRPQVIWPNGILAATAIGIAIDLLTDWTRALRRLVYMLYDGNAGTLTPHPRLEYLGEENCIHYLNEDVGSPVL